MSVTASEKEKGLDFGLGSYVALYTALVVLVHYLLYLGWYGLIGEVSERVTRHLRRMLACSYQSPALAPLYRALYIWVGGGGSRWYFRYGTGTVRTCLFLSKLSPCNLSSSSFLIFFQPLLPVWAKVFLLCLPASCFQKALSVPPFLASKQLQWTILALIAK